MREVQRGRGQSVRLTGEGKLRAVAVRGGDWEKESPSADQAQNSVLEEGGVDR